MKLFFETAAQGAVFLLMLPIGILLALFVDLCGHTSKLRILCDLLIMLLCCVAVGFNIILLNDETLRLYHLLAILIGYILYMIGARRIFRWVHRRIKLWKKAETNKKENEHEGRIE